MTWQKLYRLKRWQRRSRLNLKMFPMCARCERQGRTTAATLSHHLEPYREGDSDAKFWFGPLESACHDCHLEVHGRAATLPYRKDIMLDGFPADEVNHPFWKVSVEQERRWDTAKKRAKP